MMSTALTSPQRSPFHSSPVILVVDDDEIHRTLLNETLGRFNYQIVQASSGQECLNAYERYTPDLILLDLEMPEMDGFACLESLQLLADDHLAPVLIMSALNQPQVIEKALVAGATDYLTKPISWPILLHRIRQTLQTRQAIIDLTRQFHQDRATIAILEAQLEDQRIQHLKSDQNSQAQVMELKYQCQLKDNLIHSVSHELRSPLTNMSIAIQLLEQQFHFTLAQTDIPLSFQISLEKTLSYLAILRQQCKREIHLINNLLDLQLLENGKQFLTVESLDLKTWLPPIVEAFRQRLLERQQHLQITVMADLPPIQTDPLILERILVELLTNACKYTPPQEKIIVTVQEILIQSPTSLLAAAHPVIQISVQNTGVEIPADALEQIFEPFYRVTGSDRYHQGGTGLGLTLVQRMVAYLDGTIQVSSTPMQTQFTLEIPKDLTVE
jgi:signal transduction histidine kinase